MPTFQYVAISSTRDRIRGSIAADSPRHARDILRERGFRIEDITSTASIPSLSLGKFLRRRPSASQVATISRELATLVTVGITLADALHTLSEQHQGAVRQSLLTMHQSILTGMSFAETMRQCPDLFEDIDVSIAQMGEASGDLGAALEEIAEFKEAAGEFQDKVTTALLYPAIVFVMATGVTIFLMTSVVPSLLETLIEAGEELPYATRIVKQWSDFLVDYWWLLLSGGGAGIALLVLASRSKLGRPLFDQCVLRIPVIGPLFIKQSLARIAFIVATLIRSGVSLIDALNVASRSIGNTCIKTSLARTQEALTAGKELRHSLRDEWVIPPMVAQIFAVGQESGRLDELLTRLAKDYNKQVASVSERFTRLLDPIIIIVLAFFVGFIAFATILPIMEMGNVL